MKVHPRRRSSTKSYRSRAVRPVLEGLEGRALMYANTGNHFVFGSLITWSIEPDGVNFGGGANNLNATMNARFGAGNWQKAIQDAFAVWENVANINVSQVPDDGAYLNEGNLQQGSNEFGDIRIGSFAMDPSILAFTLLPPPSTGGSDAGEIFLNSNQAWQIGTDHDLESVMIHEIGHALGLGHSADTGAAMYAYYHGVQQTISPDDVAGVQSIWSPRQEDGFANAYANFTPANAVNINPWRGANNQINLGPLDVAKSSESYWFKVTTPANASTTLQAVVESSGLSELSPKIAIYDAGFHSLWGASAPANSYGAVVNASIYNATPNTTYYFKVSSSNSGVTGTGAYALLINMGTQYLTNFPPPNTQVAAQADQGGGSTQERIGDSATAAGSTVVTVGPVSDPTLGYANSDGDGNPVKPGNRGKPGQQVDLSAWENSHTFSASNQADGSDVPELLTIGNTSYAGDFLMTTPAPARNFAQDLKLEVTGGALIPMDPTLLPTSPDSTVARKNSSVTRINVSHPTGPF